MQNLTEEIEQKNTMQLLVKLALPAIAAQLFNAVYNIVDRIFIGHLPMHVTEALSGIGLCYPIISLITAFSWLIGMGGAPLLSIALGEHKKEEAEKIQGNAFGLLLIMGLVLTIFCYSNAETLLLWFGASENTLPYATEYLQIYSLGSIATLISMGMNPFINAQGRTDLGTFSIAIGAIINIVLDAIMIFRLGMGIRGAAFATVISQSVSAVFVMTILCFSKQITIRLRAGAIMFQCRIVKKIYALGLSSFVFMANESIASIVLNYLIRYHEGYGQTGDLYIGAMAIITTLSQIFFMPLKGITQGVQPIVGYCYGAGKIDKMKQAIIDARICGLLCAGIFWLTFMLFPYAIAAAFTSDGIMINATGYLIRISYWECILLGIQMVNQHMFVAMGNARGSLLFALMRKVILLIPLAVILAEIVGVDGIFLAEPIATVITVIITQIAFTNFLKQTEQKKAQERTSIG